MTTTAGVLARIDADFDRHLKLAQSFVRQPSISADGTGIPEMAAMVAEEIDRLGGDARVVSTEGHPVVYGHIDVNAPKTLLVYGMYDVQPVAGEDWIVPPFEGRVVDLPGFGDCVVSRGIMNSKGPLAGTLSTLESLRAANGALPVNVKFVIEGEEELGSTSLPRFFAEHADLLDADAVLFPFYSQDENGKAIQYLGAKGLVFLELRVKGGDWGGPRTRGVHGAYGAWIDSPAWVLTHALATLLSPDQARILVDGIYDDVAAPNEEDEGHLRALAGTFDPGSALMLLDAARYKFDATGADLMRRYLFEPNLNINGIVSGAFGTGSKTLLPHEAVAKIDFRLIPDMDPERVVKALRDHLDRHGFEQVTIDRFGSYAWSKSSIADAPNAALHSAYEAFGHTPEVWPLLPGSAPFYLFTRELRTPLAIGGLGHGGGQHSPNEYATVAGMKLFEKSIALFISSWAGMEP